MVDRKEWRTTNDCAIGIGWECGEWVAFYVVGDREALRDFGDDGRDLLRDGLV